jgi:hypothetical protein
MDVVWPRKSPCATIISNRPTRFDRQIEFVANLGQIIKVASVNMPSQNTQGTPHEKILPRDEEEGAIMPSFLFKRATNRVESNTSLAFVKKLREVRATAIPGSISLISSGIFREGVFAIEISTVGSIEVFATNVKRRGLASCNVHPERKPGAGAVGERPDSALVWHRSNFAGLKKATVGRACFAALFRNKT